MKKDIKYLLKLLLCFILFFNLNYLVAMLFNLVGINYNTFNYKDYTYFNVLIELILFVVVMLLYNKEFKKDYKIFKLNFKDNIRKIISYFALFMGLKIGTALISSILSFALNFTLGESENQVAVMKLVSAEPLLMIINTCILAPFVEEGIFRLSIRKVFSNKYLFILVSGLFFGMMHIFLTDLPTSLALIYSITYVAMGFYLAYIYTETENIWFVIFIHALNNLFSMIISLALL